jgi:hypothetical protein
MIEDLRKHIEDILYPDLRPFGRTDRDRLLSEAAKTSFDILEWIGILLALALVIALTRYSAVDLSAFDRILAGLANFIVAALLLAVTAGPFLVRRTRRGLRSQLHR